MKTKAFFLLLLSVVLTLSGCGNGLDVPTKTREDAPLFGTFTAVTLEGDTVTEEIFAETKLTMVNIWATFCSPCIGEMPDLGKLDGEFGEDFQVVGIVADAADRNGVVLGEQKALAQSIVSQTGADYLHLLPCAALNRAYLNRVQAVPETVFLDENGCQIGSSFLGARSKEEWKKIIEDLLEDLK